MELMLAIGLGIVTACGVYLLLRGRTFPVVLGLSLFSYGANMFIFAMGGLAAAPALVDQGVPAALGGMPILCRRRWCSPRS